MNAILTSLFSAVMGPMKSLHPGWSMAILSLVAGAAMLIVFKYTSNQRGLSRAKGKAVGQLLAIRLFKDDPWLTIRCLGGAIKDNFGYLRYMLFPFLVMFIPVVLLLVQMNLWYGAAPLTVGEETRIAIAVEGDVTDPARVKLVPAADGAYEILTIPLRIPSLNEVNWRVRVAKPGEHVLAFEVDGKPVEKRLFVDAVEPTGDLGLVAAERVGSNWLSAMLHPAESMVGGDPAVRWITVDHDARPFTILGIAMPWWLAFFILTIVFAFAIRRPLGVDF